MGREFHSVGGRNTAVKLRKQPPRGGQSGSEGLGGRAFERTHAAPATRLARVSEALGLYVDLTTHLSRLPERSLTDAANALRELATVAAHEERTVRELLVVKAASSVGLEGARQRIRRLAPPPGARRRIEALLALRSWPLFWETVAFLLGLAMALVLI